VEAGILLREGYRALILPLSFALSEAEAKAIRAFVENGGCIIADAQTGLYDDDGQPRQGSALDDLFGIRRTNSTLTAQKMSYDTEAGPVTAEFLESGVEAHGKILATGIGKAAGLRGTGLDTPKPATAGSFSVQATAKGKAIYLAAAKFRFQSEKGSFLAALLGLAGLRPALRATPVDNAALPVEIGRYRKDGMEYYVVQGMMDASADPRVRLAFASDGHVYEMRRGKYLGQGREFTDELGPGVAALYAVAPAPPKVAVKCPDRIRRGDDLTCGLSSAAPCPARVRVFAPNGDEVPYLARTATAGHPANGFSMFVPLNADLGVWRILVRNLITGEITQRDLTVEQ